MSSRLATRSRSSPARRPRRSSWRRWPRAEWGRRSMPEGAVADRSDTSLLDVVSAPEKGSSRLERRPLAVRIVGKYRIELAMVVVLLALLLALQSATGLALGGGNLANILQAAAPLVLISLGQLLVMATAGIDLSVGSVFSLAGIMGALMMQR